MIQGNMKKTGLAFFICSLLLGAGGLVGTRAATNEVELHQTTAIINLLKSHYVDRDKLDQKLLNDATVDGILQALGRGAQILSPEQAASNALSATELTSVTNEPLGRAEVIEPDIGYLRLADITENTVPALDAELKKFSDAKVRGYVLDLRFADGTNYAVAAEVASRFLAPNQELFTLKRTADPSKEFRAVESSQAAAPELTGIPLIVLINASTSGSAEALAGALHAADRGILIGGKSAGSATAWDDIKLDDGRVLRVATGKIELPNGGQIFPSGITPDIRVKIDPQVERDTVLNASTNITLTASLQAHEENKGLSEAELVRAFRGEPVEAKALRGRTNGDEVISLPAATNETGVAAAAPAQPEGQTTEVRDVVLQRAVDILKGIRVLSSSQLQEGRNTRSSTE